MDQIATSRPRTLPALFEASVERFAENVLFREKADGAWRDYTYREMRVLVHQCAAGLQALGLAKGDRVALISEGRREWPVSELGILYTGAINVPISVRIEELGELKFRLAHAGCRMAIASAPQAKKILAVLGELPALDLLILLDAPDEPVSGSIGFAELLARGAARLAEDPECAAKLWRAVEGGDAATISYTSGTTADPKGIILSHRNYTANIEQSTAMYPLAPGSVVLLNLPWDHAFAHTCGIYALASTGGSFAAVQGARNPIEAIRNFPVNVREIRPTLLLSVPAIAKTLRKGIEKGVRDKGPVAQALFRAGLAIATEYNGVGFDRGRGARGLLKPLVALFDALIFRKIRANFGGRLQYFVGGGALLDIELQRFFAAIGIPMYQGYGLTEAAPVICANHPPRHKFGSSGPIVPDLDVKICDDAGNALPVGAKGEIVVRGENVMLGYWHNPTATAETLRDGWLHTGDLGFLDPDGFLYVLGREKSLLIGHDGEKYSPEGIEEAMVEHSRYIDQVMLHNNQSASTVALVVPNQDAIGEWLTRHGHVRGTEGARAAVAGLLEEEIAVYRTGGRHAGMFPERWLPARIGVLDEPFTEQNGLMNSTMKMVRGRIEARYADLLTALHG